MPTNNISPCILFVDDEEITRKYFEKAFNKEYNVLTAENVAQAKEILQENSEEICVLVTDQRMPDANGVELLNFARENYPHIVRLLTTGYSDLNDAIAAVNKGEILRYIEKPWNLQAFNADLRNALRYYYLQNERDQLLQEKLSIRHRMVEVNRVRDLIIWSSAVTSLNNADCAIRSILLQAPVSTLRSIEFDDLEMWGALEQEIEEMLDLAKSLNKKILSAAPDHFEEFSLERLIGEFFNNASIPVDSDMMNEAKQHNVKLNRELFVILLDSLQSFFQGRESLNLNNISLRAVNNEQCISISYNGIPIIDSDRHVFSIDSDLLAVFLICAHHGGDVRLNRKPSPLITLHIPFSDTSLIEPEYNRQSIEQILSRYEGNSY